MFERDIFVKAEAYLSPFLLGKNLILDLKQKGDSIGGIVTCYISGVPRGLGERVFDKMEAQLAHAMLDQPRRPVDLDLFSQSIRIQSSQAEDIMTGLRDRLIRDLARSKGNVIAGGEGTPLPWWLVR